MVRHRLNFNVDFDSSNKYRDSGVEGGLNATKIDTVIFNSSDQCVIFDGTGYLELKQPSSKLGFNPSGNKTGQSFVFWMQVTNQVGKNQRIIEFTNNESSATDTNPVAENEYFFSIYHRSDDHKFVIEINNGTNIPREIETCVYTVTYFEILPNEWVHLVVVFSNTNPEVYIDNIEQTVEVDLSATTNSNIKYPPKETREELAIGGKTNGTANFHGKMRSFMIIDSPLTVDDINSLYYSSNDGIYD